MINTPRSGEGHDGLGPLSIREVVESALEQEDIMPVVSFQISILFTFSHAEYGLNTMDVIATSAM